MSDELAARVRAARCYADLTQPDLAKQLGLERQSIVRTENGERDPRKAELIAIAHVCGVPIDFMLGGFGAVQRTEVELDVAAKLDVILAALTQPVDEKVLARSIERLRARLAEDRTTSEAPEGQREQGRRSA